MSNHLRNTTGSWCEHSHFGVCQDACIDVVATKHNLSIINNAMLTVSAAAVSHTCAKSRNKERVLVVWNNREVHRRR